MAEGESNFQPARKLADHPHYWTIALSLLAVVFSAASFWQAHLSYQIAESALHVNSASSRPFLEISRAKLGNRPVINERLPIEIELHNIGRSAAHVLAIELVAYPEKPGDLSVGYRQDLGFSVSPGDSKMIRVLSDTLWRPSWPTDTVYAYGYIEYGDPGTAMRLVNRFCLATNTADGVMKPCIDTYGDR
jgi:hypothetical protein